MENALRRNPKIPKFVVRSDIGGDCEGGDRLSNLPEPIIHHIFLFLETIDVVRASAVSRRWRYFWLSIPYLNFNIHNIWSNPLERWSLEKINEKFKDFVNWVLLSQNGSINIQRFLLSCFNCVDDYTLYRWLSAVAQRNVQVLDLDIISEEPIKLPRCLVTCESLVSLKLDFGNREHQGVLNLPTCAGFNQLKSLDLQHVEVLDYNLFRKFLLSCPLLENLHMKECFFRDFKILDIPSTSLKYLTIDEFLLSEPKGLRSCEVICESLEALKLHFGLEIDKCVLKLPPTSVGFSRLKSLDLKHVELLDHSFFLKLISSSPFLENLIMDSCRFPDLRILDISSASLKSLTLDRIEFGGDELGSYKLKIACPNLVSFNIFALLLPDITLEGLNSLQNTFVFLEDIGEHMEDIEICHRLSKILNELRGVEVLKLSSTLYELDFGKKVYRQGVLELPTCAGFTRLKSLDLQKVELLDSNLFCKFISSCPLLENLNMEACFFCDFKILDISTTSLKHLTIDDVGFCEPKGLANCEVKLACPNLLSLKFSGSAELEFSFEGLKSLKKAYIYLDIDGDDDVCYGVSKIFNGVRNAEVLKLNMVVSWLLNVVFAKPDCFFSPLYNLKSLKLIVGPFDQTIQSTINLLNCSPNLEALAIYFDWFKDGDLWKIPDKGIPCLTHHLKTVEILEFYGNENQLELVRFILKYGQVLQKMSITWGYSGVKYPIKISRQVKEFPRLSPTAALEFLEPFYEWFDHFGL